MIERSHVNGCNQRLQCAGGRLTVFFCRVRSDSAGVSSAAISATRSSARRCGWVLIRQPPRGGKNSPKACLVLRLRFDKGARRRGWGAPGGGDAGLKAHRVPVPVIAPCLRAWACRRSDRRLDQQPSVLTHRESPVRYFSLSAPDQRKCLRRPAGLLKRPATLRFKSISPASTRGRLPGEQKSARPAARLFCVEFHPA